MQTVLPPIWGPRHSFSQLPGGLPMRACSWGIALFWREPPCPRLNPLPRVVKCRVDLMVQGGSSFAAARTTDQSQACSGVHRKFGWTLCCSCITVQHLPLPSSAFLTPLHVLLTRCLPTSYLQISVSDSSSRERELRHSLLVKACLCAPFSCHVSYRESGKESWSMCEPGSQHGGSSNNQWKVPQGKVDKMGSERLMYCPPRPHRW